ncbi:hypothetical protein T11_7492 [Trichinella zimbabwensis]|uniref:Uncharacterized protein n=1 Tax=Trichinella zimbabwensis TaxID=268475 RepID=A0A0V1I183_9BILA|nr:hypothetical protein T11_7492 [Trichinella zimbabwensis]
MVAENDGQTIIMEDVQSLKQRSERIIENRRARTRALTEDQNLDTSTQDG